jgi:hypothetical protein
MKSHISPRVLLRLALALSLLAAFAAHAGAVTQPSPSPIVLYTDTLTGPTSGGENDLGAYLSIFGKNFGPSLTNLKVYIGGAEVASYRSLGLSKVGGKLGIQQITVQVGHLGGAANGTPLPVKVVVGGVVSNVNSTFTPAAGRILFVSLNGNDGTAVAGDVTRPWRHLQDSSAGTGAYFSLKAGDHIVIRGGHWSDASGTDTTWMRFGCSPSNCAPTAVNGTSKAWIHITAYPGEDVHYTTPPGASGGIAGPWSAIYGMTGEFISVSNLRMQVSGGAARDAAPINLQYTAGPWRAVNNELGPWVAGNSEILNAAGVSGHGFNNKVLGNHIHDIQGTADLQNHGIYADSTAQNWEVAYNWIHDMVGGSLVQFNDNQGLAGSARVKHNNPDGSVTHATWRGFTGIRIHHNWLENAAKYGINFNDQGSTHMGAYEGQSWNNVIIGTKLYPIRINSTQTSQKLWFAYNTIYNCSTSSGAYSTIVDDEGFGSGPQITNKFYDNIFAFGPNTSPDTVWLVDYSTPSTPTSYEFKRNLYFTNGESAPDPSELGDGLAISADPLFADPGASNYSLKAGSPAIDAGVALPAGFTNVVDDFANAPRPVGRASDLGAFEY